ncbi:MAG: inner membrane protein YiaA [Silvanigrellaceae bacterium]
MNTNNPQVQVRYRPVSPAFAGASWLALAIGMVTYMVGIWRAEMELNEKGYYFTVYMYGLFAAVSVQKCVRDRLENIPTTGIYTGLSWLSTLLSILLLGVGLFNAELELSEKGFFGMAFVLSLFAAVAVQKNIRDNRANG